MVFKQSLTDGAALDPCLDTTSCRVEPSNDYRAQASRFWQDRRSTYTWAGPSDTGATQCLSGVTGPTQAAAGYTCGMPVLTSISLGAAALAMLVVVGQIALLGLSAGRGSGARGAKVNQANTQVVQST